MLNPLTCVGFPTKSRLREFALELKFHKERLRPDNGTSFSGVCHVIGTAKELQVYAQDCVKLANGDNVPPELRKQLLEMAREWMQAAMGEESDSGGSADEVTLHSRIEEVVTVARIRPGSPDN